MEVPPRPKTRKGRRNLAGSLRTGIHTVTIEMRKPSRYVPFMIAVGIGAFMAFGAPLIGRTAEPHIELDETSLGQLVAVHRGHADRDGLSEFTRVKALIHFEALPAAPGTGVQGSLVVLRESRVVSSKMVLAILGQGGTYETLVDGVSVLVRRHKGALHVLIDSKVWPTIELPEPPS